VTFTRAGHDESGVMHLDSRHHRRAERFVQRGEPRIGVHEHRIEVRAEDRRGAVVVPLLLRAAIDEKIAHAADDDRPRHRPGRVEQRHQLLAELPAAERKQLDEDDRRRYAAVDIEQLSGSRTAQLFDRSAVADDGQAATLVLRERGQIDHFDIVRWLQVARTRAAARKDHSELVRQRAGKRPRPREVSHAERVLAVEEESRPRTHDNPIPRSRTRTASRSS
jgi:hypothetical protein